MRQVPHAYNPNLYKADTPEEMVVQIMELKEKSDLLHDARSKAWHAMNDAIAEHDFVRRCADACDREGASARHRLEELIRRDAYSMFREGS